MRGRSKRQLANKSIDSSPALTFFVLALIGVLV